MDYIKESDFKIFKDLDEAMNYFKDETIYYVTRYSKNVYSSFDYSDIVHDIYFMFGRESSGIPLDLLRANIDKTVRIPMVPSARSLNLSNSVAIVLFEALRQQKFFNLSTQELIKGEDFLINEEAKSE